MEDGGSIKDGGSIPLMTWSSDGSVFTWDACSERVFNHQFPQPDFPVYDVAVAERGITVAAAASASAGEWIAVVGGCSKGGTNATTATAEDNAADTYSRCDNNLLVLPLPSFVWLKSEIIKCATQLGWCSGPTMGIEYRS